MKTIKISSGNEVSIIDVNFDDFRDIQRAVGGYFEMLHVRSMRDYFERPIIMLVDDEFIGKKLRTNVFGCIMYDTWKHGHPICGNVILAEQIHENFTGLDDAEEIMQKLLSDFKFLRKVDK